MLIVTIVVLIIVTVVAIIIVTVFVIVIVTVFVINHRHNRNQTRRHNQSKWSL